MKKLLLLFIVVSQICFAQSKLLTMEEAVLKQRTTLNPTFLKQLMWLKGTSKYSYVKTTDNVEVLVIGEVEGGKLKDGITLTQLNSALMEGNFNEMKSFPPIAWENEKEFSFSANKQRLAYNIETKKLSLIRMEDYGADAENMDVSENGKYVAYTLKNNLFVYDGKNKNQVTNDADENIVNGKSVHREEFGIVKGTFWSPKSNLLAFYRMDQTMVTDYPIIDWTTQPATNKNIKYPMAGAKSHEVTIGIYNVNSEKTIFLKTGEPKEQYLTNIAWSPDEKQIYVAILNRDQNYLKMNCYNASTGEFEKTLFEEKDEKYVQPVHPIQFVKNNSNQFIWQSEKDGFNHIYLYDIIGKEIKQLTKGNWVVVDVMGFDNKGEKLFFTSTAEGAWNRDFHSVDLKSGEIKKLTSGVGTHNIVFNNNYFIDNFQSTSVPREISIYNTDGKKLNVLHTAPNPLKEYALGELLMFTIKNKENTDLYCRLYKPAYFDSTKKYPVIVYLYNGPNVQLIQNRWNGGGDLWFQYMAQRDFVVFTVDGRGSNFRGKAFEQATFKHLGKVEMEDQLAGVNYLKSLSYVDEKRMGVFGWSYGGFMTTSLMTKYPDVFKVAVAGGPVIDWSYYEIMYTERYMDTPQNNVSGYTETNVMNSAKNLKGKLLLIHGAQDPVVVWQHSILFLKKCVDLGKPVDYFVYPGHEHNVLGKDREHLYQKVTDYFMQNL